MKTRAVEPWTVEKIVDYINNGWLNPHPEFQRNAVWTGTQKRELVENIVCCTTSHLPVPPIFIHEKSPHEFEIVDGQQRISALVGFFQSEFPIFVNNLVEISHVSETYRMCRTSFKDEIKRKRKRIGMHPEIQKKFLRTNIPIFIVEAATEMELYDLFYKLNNGTAVNYAEIRNAYPSATRTWVREISEWPIFDRLVCSNKRFQKTDIATKFLALSLELSGVTFQRALDTPGNLSKIIKEEFPEVENVKPFMKKTLKSFELALADRVGEKPGYKEATLFYTVLWHAIVGNKVVNASTTQACWKKFLETHNELLERSVEYHDFHYKANKAWRYRKEAYEKHFECLLDIFPQKDEKRFFSTSQKNQRLNTQDGMCNDCGGFISWDVAEGDHEFPHFVGGLSSNKNLQMLCVPCHEKKTVQDCVSIKEQQNA